MGSPQLNRTAVGADLCMVRRSHSEGWRRTAPYWRHEQQRSDHGIGGESVPAVTATNVTQFSVL